MKNQSDKLERQTVRRYITTQALYEMVTGHNGPTCELLENWSMEQFGVPGIENISEGFELTKLAFIFKKIDHILEKNGYTKAIMKVDVYHDYPEVLIITYRDETDEELKARMKAAREYKIACEMEERAVLERLKAKYEN